MKVYHGEIVYCKTTYDANQVKPVVFYKTLQKSNQEILVRDTVNSAFLHALSSQTMLFQQGQNQRVPRRSQFGCKFPAGVWHRNEDSETKHYYFCKPLLAVETATAAFHLICLLLPFYTPLHLDINKALVFAMYCKQTF